MYVDDFVLKTTLFWHLQCRINSPRRNILKKTCTGRKNRFPQICSLHMSQIYKYWGKHGKCHICLVIYSLYLLLSICDIFSKSKFVQIHFFVQCWRIVHTLVQAHKPEHFVLLTYSIASPSRDQALKGLVGKKFILMHKLSFEVINLKFCFPKWLHAFFKLVLQTIYWLYNVKKIINQLNKRTTDNKIISQNQPKFCIPKTIAGFQYHAIPNRSK